jgi:DNA recombination protein RmuC
LRAVKTEFGKFGDALANVKKSLDSASHKIGQTESRTRVMMRSLKSVEAMPEDQARDIFAADSGDADRLELEDKDSTDTAPSRDK